MTYVPGGDMKEYCVFKKFYTALNHIDCRLLTAVGRAICNGKEKSLNKITAEHAYTYRALVAALRRELAPGSKTSQAVLEEINLRNYA
jgi:hypothetical protein